MYNHKWIITILHSVYGRLKGMPSTLHGNYYVPRGDSHEYAIEQTLLSINILYLRTEYCRSREDREGQVSKVELIDGLGRL